MFKKYDVVQTYFESKLHFSLILYLLRPKIIFIFFNTLRVICSVFKQAKDHSNKEKNKMKDDFRWTCINFVDFLKTHFYLGVSDSKLLKIYWGFFFKLRNNVFFSEKRHMLTVILVRFELKVGLILEVDINWKSKWDKVMVSYKVIN